MNIFWLIAAMNVAFIAFALLAGRIDLRQGRPVIDRDVDPLLYWMFIGASVIAEIGLIVAALTH